MIALTSSTIVPSLVEIELRTWCDVTKCDVFTFSVCFIPWFVTLHDAAEVDGFGDVTAVR